MVQQQLDQLLLAAPNSTPLFLTLTTTDCEPGEIREQVKTIRRGWQNLFRSDGRKRPLLGRKATAAAGWIEVVSSSASTDLYNVHAHTALVMGRGYPYTGRDRIRQTDSSHWFDWWRAAMGDTARSADAQLVDNLVAVLCYSFKTSFEVIDANGGIKQPAYVDPHTKQLLPAARILQMQDELSGLTRSLSYGSVN